MENFDEVCRSIDWDKMAQGRIAVKNLAEKKPALNYIAALLDLITETAVDKHGVSLYKAYPKARVASLITKAKQSKN